MSRKTVKWKKKSGEIVYDNFSLIYKGDNAHIKTQSGIKQNLKMLAIGNRVVIAIRPVILCKLSNKIKQKTN